MYAWMLWETVAVTLGMDERILGTADLYVHQLTFSLKP